MEQEKKLGMTWHKVNMWFRLPLGTLSCVLSLPSSIEAAFYFSLPIALIFICLDIGLLVYLIACWYNMSSMSPLGYKLKIGLIIINYINFMLSIILDNGLLYYFFEEPFAASVLALFAFFIVGLCFLPEYFYYKKRKHLFFEEGEDEYGAETVVFSASSVAAPVVTAASAVPVSEKPIMAERAAPVAASVSPAPVPASVPAPAPAPVPVPAPAPAAETAALAPQADAEAAIEEEAVVPMPAKTESSAEPFKTDFVSPAKPAPCISFCRHCGKKLEEGSVFCNRCGKKVMWDE